MLSATSNSSQCSRLHLITSQSSRLHLITVNPLRIGKYKFTQIKRLDHLDHFRKGCLNGQTGQYRRQQEELCFDTNDVQYIHHLAKGAYQACFGEKQNSSTRLASPGNWGLQKWPLCLISLRLSKVDSALHYALDKGSTGRRRGTLGKWFPCTHIYAHDSSSG